ncbi:hypothetical protein ACFQ3J_12720 [Paenibacillus provencensis]|uniref:Uncharacterized protein n=1 Tax=Paenibacillus provencensis TaxID=441151 RepID=A0ABW3PTQ8_9BACL|nr:hypothetical protein [Paenibacillus sp. MER 78]MCM3127504.1 hypothetical protein [Paenibacillus sp. MER 78]
MNKRVLIAAGGLLFLAVIYITSRSFFLTEPPDLIGRLDEQEILFHKGTYVWTSGVADAPEPTELANQYERYEVTPETDIILSFSVQPSEYSAEQVTAAERISLPIQDNKIRTPSEPGTYFIVVYGEWPAGTGTYVVKLKVNPK